MGHLLRPPVVNPNGPPRAEHRWCPNVAAIHGTLFVVSKYDSLREHLDRLPAELVQLSFAEIDRIVAGLPPSAYEHRAWWSNQRQGSHVQATSWLDAGRRVESVDLNTTRVTFTARHG